MSQKVLTIQLLIGNQKMWAGVPSEPLCLHTQSLATAQVEVIQGNLYRGKNAAMGTFPPLQYAPHFPPNYRSNNAIAEKEETEFPINLSACRARKQSMRAAISRGIWNVLRVVTMSSFVISLSYP
eukprot:TRINITY_DN16353_c0_g1_i7.p2 TRINITY_DN16353_c0_g1~~TRINITY_DN16353_c0_g1_i7.p2  ORF type:complete len:125 (-),score=21.04 TRINITY_DN16353_c0_g1_i7:31-405(-)